MKERQSERERDGMDARHSNQYDCSGNLSDFLYLLMFQLKMLSVTKHQGGFMSQQSVCLSVCMHDEIMAPTSSILWPVCRLTVIVLMLAFVRSIPDIVLLMHTVQHCWLGVSRP